jgi:hypothetical protein
MLTGFMPAARFHHRKRPSRALFVFSTTVYGGGNLYRALGKISGGVVSAEWGPPNKPLILL